MVAGRTDFALAASADHVAGAILIGAEERTTTLYSFRLVRFGRVKAAGWSLGIACDTALFGKS